MGLRSVAETLGATRGHPLDSRTKIFRSLAAEWHPDRHTSTGQEEIATKVFQWLQVVKSWFLETGSSVQVEQQPLPDDPDKFVDVGVPEQANISLHRSGN